MVINNKPSPERKIITGVGKINLIFSLERFDHERKYKPASIAYTADAVIAKLE